MHKCLQKCLNLWLKLINDSVLEVWNLKRKRIRDKKMKSCMNKDMKIIHIKWNMKRKRILNKKKVREEVEDYVDQTAFEGRLFSRRYKHRESNDILQAGQQYKSKIRETVQEHINRGIRFYIVYEVELEKYGDGEEDDNKTVYLHSANRRIFNMYEFDDVYEQAMTKINDQFEDWMGEGSGWVMDRINSIDMKIARL